MEDTSNIFGESVVIRMRYESPVEIVLALAGGLAATAAFLDKMIDIYVKLRTLDPRVEGERKEWETRIAKSEKVISACNGIREGLVEKPQAGWAIQDVVIYDDPDLLEAEDD